MGRNGQESHVSGGLYSVHDANICESLSGNVRKSSLARENSTRGPIGVEFRSRDYLIYLGYVIKNPKCLYRKLIRTPFVFKYTYSSELTAHGET